MNQISDILLVGAAFLPLLLGWLLDLALGDPEQLPHPVVWMGRLIGWGEKRLNCGNHRRLKGGLWAVGCIALAYVLTAIVVRAAASYLILYTCACAILIYYSLAGRTLRKEVRMVFEALDRSLDDGRRQVSRIVGRDTSELSAQEVRKAALETLAENLSDGVIAPLFWLFLLGVPGMLAYKMVNTLDSMIGYRTERYREFGCVAARIDDVANYVPARLTALLMVAMPMRCRQATDQARSYWKRLRQRLHFLRYYGPQHASPNSGWPEAALAGMLDCRFGGPHYYFNEYFHKPFIGHNDRQLTTDDMWFSVRLALIVEGVSVTAIVLFQFLLAADVF